MAPAVGRGRINHYTGREFLIAGILHSLTNLHIPVPHLKPITEMVREEAPEIPIGYQLATDESGAIEFVEKELRTGRTGLGFSVEFDSFLASRRVMVTLPEPCDDRQMLKAAIEFGVNAFLTFLPGDREDEPRGLLDAGGLRWVHRSSIFLPDNEIFLKPTNTALVVNVGRIARNLFEAS